MRKLLLIGFAMVFILLVGVLTGCSSAEAMVTFSDQNKQIIIDSSSDTLSEVLEEQGFNISDLKQQYKPSIPWDQPVKGQSRITLTCKCEVKLTVGGQELGTRETLQTTVKAFLQEQKVQLTDWDEINTPLDAKIVDGMEINIDRIEQRVKKKVEEIPFKTVEEKDNTIADGKKKTETEGKQGKKIFEVVMLYKNGKPFIQDGKPVHKEKLIETINPVDKVVKIGTNKELAEKEKPKLASAGSMRVEATGYTHTGNRTATGTWPKRGTIAVDPRVIPLGTKLYIPGYGYGIAEDTGGVVKGNIIDLFFETREEAIKWGRRTVTIQIVK